MGPLPLVRRLAGGMRPLSLAALVAAVCLGSGCGESRETPDAPAAPVQARASTPRIVERIRDLLQPTKRVWRARVEEAAVNLETEPEACRLRPEEVEHELYRIGRTSHRPLASVNAPEPWMEPILLELQQRPPRRFAARVANLPGGRLGYAEPLYTERACAGCHGSSGFEEGDFQGLFWVIVEPELLGAKVARPN